MSFLLHFLKITCLFTNLLVSNCFYCNYVMSNVKRSTSNFKWTVMSIGTDVSKGKSSNDVRYRLWGDEGILVLGPLLAKPVGLILNLVGDLLRIQGSSSIYPPEEIRRLLFDACSKCSPNGLSATFEIRQEIDGLVRILEASNPTPDPANSILMDGFWRLIYTSADSGGNAGKIGPFIGEVYQDLNGKSNQIQNICRVKFPPIEGRLTARQSISNNYAWKIDFQDIQISFFGLKFPARPFPKGIYRIWEITYLDKNLRILRARSPDKTKDDSFLFILVRDDSSRDKK